MEIYAIDPDFLSRFFDRERKPTTTLEPPKIDLVFGDILRVANKFVPSEAGSILLDDPELKFKNGPGQEHLNELVFIACFGEKAQMLPGTRIRADKGIIGKVYLSGQSYISADVHKDKHFFGALDQQTKYDTQAVVCVPIKIANSICGVLELINRIERVHFLTHELELLEIFAHYISTSMQNLLDANRQRELAQRDDLTGLYNDRYFFSQLDSEMKIAQSQDTELSLIFFDLDHFKQVNDKYGHLSGSRVLKEIGSILRNIVKRPAYTMARYGGDEFVIIAPESTPQEVLAVAEMIRSTIENYCFLSSSLGPNDPRLDIRGVITTSIGVASLSTAQISMADPQARKNELIRIADMAMYRAKALGKNRIVQGR